MTTTIASESQTFTIAEEIHVRASIDETFASLIAQMGRLNETPDGKPLPMVLEPRPGGRWYRELGSDNGHMWGFVQSIKRPTLLEIWGPLFMSTAATSNLLYRLTETPDGTLITFKHTLVGPFPEDHRSQISTGWTALHARVRKAAEAAAK
jgi:Activator of Hsp90 ATPase homolog 1-like protein